MDSLRFNSASIYYLVEILIISAQLEFFIFYFFAFLFQSLKNKRKITDSSDSLEADTCPAVLLNLF